MHTPLLWADIETTGLSEHADRMLELGLVLTDANLGVVSTFEMVLGWPRVRELDIHPIVRGMHEENGLFDEVELSSYCLREVEDRALTWVKEHDAAGLFMAGSGVGGFDRRWFRHLMPHLAKVWAHRNVDLTTLRYFFGTSKEGDVAHRAVPDILQSVDQLRGFVTRARQCGLIALPMAVSA